jgi:hypothetical protein
MPRARKYPVELLDRATRLVFESQTGGIDVTHSSRSDVIRHEPF